MGDKTHYASAEEMFAAGFCVRVWDINSDLDKWAFRDERFSTVPGSVEIFHNSAPDIPLARVEQVRANAWKRRAKHGR